MGVVPIKRPKIQSNDLWIKPFLDLFKITQTLAISRTLAVQHLVHALHGQGHAVIHAGEEMVRPGPQSALEHVARTTSPPSIPQQRRVCAQRARVVRVHLDRLLIPAVCSRVCGRERTRASISHTDARVSVCEIVRQ